MRGELRAVVIFAKQAVLGTQASGLPPPCHSESLAFARDRLLEESPTLAILPEFSGSVRILPAESGAQVLQPAEGRKRQRIQTRERRLAGNNLESKNEWRGSPFDRPDHEGLSSRRGLG
ncbi:MAG: hypothetical protein D6679_11440 [Candidatus Hydrogenedentota bacterium]|nr:MAG: hypothetical protein D6679_11440 [Candidatus Hydrogenedentota bacterium]